MVDKDVTVGGDVPHPLTVTAPVGTPMREVIALSGFTGAKEDYALIVGGPCMGKLEEDWDAPVTKTTGGLLMLRRTHLLIARRTQSPERLLKIARAVCCQCSQCTQMCPRNALGLHVEPHKAMRAITTGNGALLATPLGAGLLQLRRVHQLCLPHGPFALGGHGAAQGRAGTRGHPPGA